jgi:hypothetical protein
VSALEVTEPQYSDLALEAGRRERARRAEVLGRAEPPRRDPGMMTVAPTVELVDLVEQVVDADPELIDFIETQILEHRLWKATTDGRLPAAGRPIDYERRTMVVAFLLLAFTQPNFHIVNLAGLLGEIPPEVRDRLGIDRVVKIPNTGLAGTEADYRPTQLSYRQALGFLDAIGDAFDPTFPDLDEAEQSRRAAALQELMRRIVELPRRALMPEWTLEGDVAVDATMKWGWDRPPGKAGKIPRRGKDGEAGASRSLSDMIGADVDVEALGFDDFDAPQGAAAPPPAPEPADGEADAEAAPEPEDAGDGGVAAPAPGPNRRQRRAHRRGRRPGGAAWVGRTQMANSIYGYAVHTAVNTGDGPAVVVHASVTRAPANPAAAALPMLRDFHDARAADPAVAAAGVRPLGHVVADGVYSAPWGWQLGIRALGGSPVFRMHPNNQEGRRMIAGEVFLNGRPVCECCPRDLDEAWPAFKDRATKAIYAAANQIAARRRQWEWAANGKAKPDGRRQFVSPHGSDNYAGGRGGCEHCVTADGEAVIGPDGAPKPRCCQTRTKVFTAEDLRWYQDETFGTLEWYRRWNIRNRVEGSYGIVKQKSLMDWGRDYHHFTGLARESIVTAFAFAAYNMHMIRSWFAQQAAAARKKAREDRKLGRIDPRHLPPAVPTETVPPNPVEPVRKRRAPKGLPELGDDPPDS